MDDDLRGYLRSEIEEEGAYGYLDRDELVRRLRMFDEESAAGGITADAGRSVMSVRGGSDAGPMVREDDPDITTSILSVQSDAETVQAYVVRPSAADAMVPGILVIHENRGLTPYIRDVARRLATQGYVALAPDLLSPRGGADSFTDPAEAIAALGTLDRDEMLQELRASLNTLASLDGVDKDRLGVVGFCFGGGLTWRIATLEPRLKAAVPFYGPNPPLDAVADIGAAVLGIYGALDERITSGAADIAKAMSDAGKTFEMEIYPDSQHAFHNDTNPERYNATTAPQAWQRALDWLKSHL